jgi:ribosome biogenesis GTPase
LTKRQLTKQQRKRIENNQLNASAKTDVLEAHIEEDSENVSGEKLGIVTASYGAQIDVEEINSSKRISRRCHLRANLPIIVAGDKVTWKDYGDYGVVIARHPRKTQICRPDDRGNLRAVAANVNRIAIVISLYPKPHSNLIDRYIVESENQSIRPLLIINKADLIVKENCEALLSLVSKYKDLGYDHFFVSAKNGHGLEQLEAYLNNFTSVLVGQSGVGKSSLLNKLIPKINLKVGGLSESKKKGIHTTTTSQLFHLNNGGSVVDSPGVREFGLLHLEPDEIANGFIEFIEYLGKCKFRNCSHKRELGCALIIAVKDGKIARERFDSYLHMVHSTEKEKEKF